MPQRVLVLGARGFIGRHLVTRLRASGWASPVAGVRSARSEPEDGLECRIVEATDGNSVRAALDGMDAVVNCVAGSATDISEGARVLFEAALQAEHRPRIIHLSSMAVYGDAIGLVPETTPLKGDLGPYAAAKVAAERFAAGYSDAAVLRPGCVYGPGSVQWSTRFAQWLVSRRLGDLGARGDGYCNLVHVDDVVESIVQCLQRRSLRATVFNLAAADPPTWNEYLIRYGQALNAVPVRRVTRRRLMIEAKLLAPPLKIAELALRISRLPIRLPPPIPPSVLRLMQQEIRLDVRQAERELGLRWKPLRQGIEETADWYLRSSRANLRESMAL